MARLAGAGSTENDRHCAHPVIALITEWTTGAGDVERRDESSDLGGTMRLGAQECRQQFEDLGLVIAGKSMDDLLVEIIELPEQQHPWFVACQFHPEFTSTPRDGHPLFMGFVHAAREYKAVRSAPRFAK